MGEGDWEARGGGGGGGTRPSHSLIPRHQRNRCCLLLQGETSSTLSPEFWRGDSSNVGAYPNRSSLCEGSGSETRCWGY